MTKTLRNFLLELLLVVMLVPQAFVFFYYFTFFFRGGNSIRLLWPLARYALTISWVSAPFIVVTALLVKVLLARQVRWYVTVAFCWGAGYVWLAAWNYFVYDIFSYGQAILPMLLCSLGAAGYALARDLYQRDLLPATIKNNAEGLSE